MNSELRERGYLPAKGLLEPGLARVMYRTLLLMHWRGEAFRDNHIPTAASVSNVAATDAVLPRYMAFNASASAMIDPVS